MRNLAYDSMQWIILLNVLLLIMIFWEAMASSRGILHRCCLREYRQAISCLRISLKGLLNEVSQNTNLKFHEKENLFDFLSKPGRAPGKTTTILGLLRDLRTYGR